MWLSLTATIEDRATREMTAALQAAPFAPLCLWIDSEGGDGDCTFELYRQIRQRAAETHAHITNRCYSGALIVALACDVRSADPRARFLAHNSNCRMSGFRTAAQLRTDAEWLATLDRDMAEVIGQRTRYPRWRLQDDMAEERYIDAQEAWLFGILTVQPKLTD